MLLAAAVRFDHAHRGGRHLSNALQDRPGRRHDRVPAHVELQSLGVDRGVDAARRDDAREGRGEAQPFRRLRIIKWLDPEPVAGEHDAPALALVDGEGEHAVEALHALRAPSVKGLEDHLRVAAGEEAVALSLQLVAQRLVIVDAAVEDRSEEHTSELQSLMRISYAVFCLKKKTKNPQYTLIAK